MAETIPRAYILLPKNVANQLDGSGGRFLVSDIGPEALFTREDVTDEQRMFAATAAAFMRQEVLPHESRLYSHDWPFTRALLLKAGELDLLRLEIPEQYGGLALSKVSGALVGEQIATNPSFGASLGAHTAIGTLPLLYFGTAAQKAKYLPRLASGEMIGAYALTEPGSGSDARAAKMSAVLSADGQHYLLNGQKMWITNGGFADLFTVFAKVNGDRFTAFLVERAMGVVSGAEEKKLGLDGSSTTALMFDNVKVPVENVLGRIGEGHKVAFNTLNLGRVKLGARNMACARQALAHAAQYAKDRRQFGHPIGDFGLIKHKLADMAIHCFVGDAMVFRTLGAVDEALEAIDPADGERVLSAIETFAVECSVNKVFTSEALGWIADQAIQVFGGNGYSREFPVERIYRDARITRIYEGTNEINRMLISLRLLKNGGAAAPDDETRRPTAGRMTAERTALGRIKSLGAAMLLEASHLFGNTLKDEQEVLARIADVVIDAYAVESAVGRAEKLELSKGSEIAGTALEMTRVFVADAVARVVHAARPVIKRLGSKSAGVERLLAPLVAFDSIDTIGARRRIADDILTGTRQLI